MQDISVQLSDQKRLVDFKSYDLSVKELISMVSEGIINISPEYQRKFRWEDERQSLLIESIFLGLSTLIRFAAKNDSPARRRINKPDSLRLKGLEKLSSMNGKTFEDLPYSLQLDFLLKPMKVTTLSDKSDPQVRFDLFQRLNTGGIKLTDQEIRNCIFKGNFNDLIKRLAKDERLHNLTKKPTSADNNGTYEELVLRFFAYLYNRDLFVHNVKDLYKKEVSNRKKIKWQ